MIQLNEFANFLNVNNVDIAAIFGTKLNRKMKIKCLGYYVYRRDQSKRSGGVALVLYVMIQ